MYLTNVTSMSPRKNTKVAKGLNLSSNVKYTVTLSAHVVCSNVPEKDSGQTPQAQPSTSSTLTPTILAQATTPSGCCVDIVPWLPTLPRCSEKAQQWPSCGKAQLWPSNRPPARQGPVTQPPCQPHQSLNCAQAADHLLDNQQVAHCCAHCLRTTGFRHTHPEALCRKAQEAGKVRRGRMRHRQAKE